MSKRVGVEIITIGDEILIGQIVDTNSAWMAVELNKAGFDVVQITSVHDQADHIVEALKLALGRADVVLFTGGIGPTNDDITKLTLANFFDSRLVYDPSVIDNIENLFANKPGFVINELTRSQAMVPECSLVIQNKVGTAPVLWFETEGKIVVSMPGVPYEMKYVMSTEVIARMQDRFSTPSLVHKTVLVYGYGESTLAMMIADWENSLPENISLAYLPHYGVVKLRLSGYSDDALALEFTINQYVDQLSQLLGPSIVALEDVSVESLIATALRQKGLKIATAESCTGGYIAHLLTSMAGSSDYFNGSVVAYSNEVKKEVLGVAADDLETYGAVSAQVVEQMAIGVRRLLKADVAIATSGIAGPGGGSDEKPVGTVWIAVASEHQVVAKEFRFGSLREQNIHRSAQAGLLMLRNVI